MTLNLCFKNALGTGLERVDDAINASLIQWGWGRGFGR